MPPIQETLLFEEQHISFIYGSITLLGIPFQETSIRQLSCLSSPHLLLPFRRDSVCPMPFSLAATKSITFCFLFLLVLRCFNSQSKSSSQNMHFKHSEILGSKAACTSPKLIAACHVLHHNSNRAIRLTV